MKDKSKIVKDVVYNLSEDDNKIIVCDSDNFNVICMDILDNLNKKITINDDSYFLVNSYKASESYSFSIDFMGKTYFVNCSNKILVFCDANLLVEKDINGLFFIEKKVFGEFLLLFFENKRKFLVALKKDVVIFCDYFDEINDDEREKYFMCNCMDSLRHGKVLKLTEKDYENYLVYLKDEKIELTPDFVSLIFMDCLLVKNYKYCNLLLSKEIKVEYPDDISKFFPTFDYYINLTDNKFILLNKGAMACALKFEIDSDKIVNIHIY